MGQLLRWARCDREGERTGGWHYGSTVTRIYRGVTWMVELDVPPDRGAGGWSNPILAGDSPRCSLRLGDLWELEQAVLAEEPGG